MKHEEKICPRCNIPFECKVGSINLCQCNVVVLTEDERYYLRKNYRDCLCGPCMLALKSQYHSERLTEKMDHLLRKSKVNAKA